MSERTAEAWDAVAAGFDETADHGLRDVAVRAAWAALLERVLPSAPGVIADLGCGTGSLSVLAAEQGHRVVGVDFSGAMLAVARSKAGCPSTAGRGGGVAFVQADVSAPPLARPGSTPSCAGTSYWGGPIRDERYVVTAISPAVPGRGPSAPGRKHGGGGC